MSVPFGTNLSGASLAVRRPVSRFYLVSVLERTSGRWLCLNCLLVRLRLRSQCCQSLQSLRRLAPAHKTNRWRRPRQIRGLEYRVSPESKSGPPARRSGTIGSGVDSSSDVNGGMQTQDDPRFPGNLEAKAVQQPSRHRVQSSIRSAW